MDFNGFVLFPYGLLPALLHFLKCQTLHKEQTALCGSLSSTRPLAAMTSSIPFLPSQNIFCNNRVVVVDISLRCVILICALEYVFNDVKLYCIPLSYISLTL